ncbi:hypothetical protein VTJ49DRAFT_376 [Mycothermus thermophilus]|uniref:Uncharacterized protein n=1 Tax=Humicola insolens TaxID=85995 RepID=A0ABR3VRG1_HUMIN
MAISPTLPAVLGAAAFFPTSAALAIQIILARSPVDHAPSVRSAASASAFFEAVIFVTIPLISLSYVARWAPNFDQKMWLRCLWLAGGLVVCIAATTAGIAAVACLGRVDDDPQSTIVDSRAGDFLIGSSIVLALASATQLLFFIIHLMAGRTPPTPPEPPRPSMETKPASRIKTIPYQKTASSTKERGSKSFDSSTPPGSSSGRSASETLVSIRSSLSHAVRPMSSKTRLLSLSRMSSHNASSSVVDLPMPPPEARTPPSRAGDEEQGFDSWDTSGVAPETRQTVMEQCSSPSTSPGQTRVSRFLETIPASRSPSPAEAVAAAAVAAAEAASAAAKAAAAVAAAMAEEKTCPLEPPPRSAARRSRSYSPISTRVIEAQRAAFNPPLASPTGESNIHPLFRSDSPVPPPSATPGTVVVAAPNAGQVIPGQGIRTMHSLRRLRSESLPPTPSPLSRAQSCESFLQHRHQKMMHRRAESLLLSPQIREEDEGGVAGTQGQGPAPTERKMTPPIPEWILAAGQRTSLTAYHRRKSSQSWQSPLQWQQEGKRAEWRPATRA